MLADAESNGSVATLSRQNASDTAHPPTSHQRESSTTNGIHKPAFKGSTSSPAQPDKSAAVSPVYFGHDREEVTRLLIQTLADMGYQSAAESVRRESGFELESPTVAAFRKSVLQGAWADTEELLSGAVTAGDTTTTSHGNGLVLAPGADKTVMRFWIRQQKFLELLERKETSRALLTLRGELTPLYQDPQKLQFLSSLLMCQSTEVLKARAAWDGAQGQSRKTLLSDLSSKYIS